MKKIVRGPVVVLLLTFLAVAQLQAGPLKDWLQERRLDKAERIIAKEQAALQQRIPDNIQVLRDLPYGEARAQTLDVYLPEQPVKAPLVVMVHGGAWRTGDKGTLGTVYNKMQRWVPADMALVSVNYRLLPEAGPEEQVQDVARALAWVQSQARDWGADPDNLVLMGHSAGAHLVSTLTADPGMAMAVGATPWLGTVSLDTAVLDVEDLMQRRHLALYDDAFGDDPALWKRMSPTHLLDADSLPLLAVCSTRRKDNPCEQARAYVERATSLQVRAQSLPQRLTHKAINADLGEPGEYTKAVEAFMASLSPAMADRLNAID